MSSASLPTTATSATSLKKIGEKWELFLRRTVLSAHAHKYTNSNPASLSDVLWCSLLPRGGGLGSRPKNMYGETLGDGVEYHFQEI